MIYKNKLPSQIHGLYFACENQPKKSPNNSGDVFRL